MARKVTLLALFLLVSLSLGCASRKNITRIDGLTPKYTFHSMIENAGQDLHMAGDDWIMFWGLDEPSRLSPDHAFKY